MGIWYQVSKIDTKSRGSLIDILTYGGLAKDDLQIICNDNSFRYIDISEVNDYQVKDLEIVTASGVAPSQQSSVIIILHQYALLGTRNTIQSCIQLDSYKNIVDDKTIYYKGSQIITTINGYIHPLDLITIVPYLSPSPYTDEEWVTLSHVI